LAKYYQDDQIREDEMSLACSMHRKEEKWYRDLVW
jgi:hypothetical protein